MELMVQMVLHMLQIVATARKTKQDAQKAREFEIYCVLLHLVHH